MEILVQSRRNKAAALKLTRRLLKRQGFLPDTIVTDKLPSYGAALRDLGLSRRHDFGGRKNNCGVYRRIFPWRMGLCALMIAG